MQNCVFYWKVIAMNKNELLILNKLYDGTENELNTTYIPQIDTTDEKAKYRELVYYLEELKDKKLIEIKTKEYYTYGGQMNCKYKNAATSVPFWEHIKISQNGKLFINELRLSKFKKAKRASEKLFIKFVGKILDKLLTVFISFVVGLLVGNADRIKGFIWNLFS